ncbi:hypothetical protein G9A89_008093 [Geosiphon pyriformis]|nr:hypothetical protein G9A89_008093 [Geosiphon pyriformis]
MDPNADTEWNDILRAHGILPKKEGPTEDEILEAMDEVIAARNEKGLEERTLDELDELEDEEDDRVLFEYRKRRIAEMKAESECAKYGQLIQISKPDFIREVTEASKVDWVVVHLFKDSVPVCKLLNTHLTSLAAKHRLTKFIKIIGDQCIPNYPDRNLPTLLIYGEGDIKEQVVGAERFGGMGMTLEGLESFLGSLGAIENPTRSSKKEETFARKTIYGKNLKTASLSEDEYSD